MCVCGAASGAVAICVCALCVAEDAEAPATSARPPCAGEGALGADAACGVAPVTPRRVALEGAAEYWCAEGSVIGKIPPPSPLGVAG